MLLCGVLDVDPAHQELHGEPVAVVGGWNSRPALTHFISFTVRLLLAGMWLPGARILPCFSTERLLTEGRSFAVYRSKLIQPGCTAKPPE